MKRIVALLTTVLLLLTIFPNNSFAQTTNTSKLGHIKNESVRIFNSIGEDESSFTAEGLINKVYYIKKQAKVNGETYYLLSTQPSSERGVIGWINSKDVDTRTHVGVDSKSKNLIVKGIGHAYSKAWGGSEDIVFSDLSVYKDQVFKVNKTEKVGNNIWYRGILDGKQVFLHSNWVIQIEKPVQIEESNVSMLGHFINENVRIFKKLLNYDTSFTAAGLTNKVYYIKKQAKVNGKTYYLMSNQPSSERGLIGWVYSGDVDTRTHVGVDSKSKELYVNGHGHAYSRAWGGTKDIVFHDLRQYAGKVFHVNKTEKVGNNIWYRGILDGKQVFLHSNWVNKVEDVSSTSLLGHFKNENVKIYNSLGDFSNSSTAAGLTNKVYYIKKQAKVNGKTYYLMSNQPSSERGLIGWVYSGDVDTRTHVGVDSKSKHLYVKGNGLAYSRAWGGNRDVVFNDLTTYKNHLFRVNKTERVGKNIWYRGILDGKQVFLHANWVDALKESSTSRLGHLKNENVTIFKTIGDYETAYKATGLTNAVYYIKKQASVNGETFYLISTQPSSERGLIGWVNSNDLDTRTHVGVDSKQKNLYVKGIGIAYSKAWGGTKDIVYPDLSSYKGSLFKVNKTERVGNNIWYRGILDGKQVFLHSSYVEGASINYSYYNITLDEAVKLQMIAAPQTDKYRNSPAYISSDYVKVYKGGTITGSSVRIRTSPNLNTNQNIYITVGNGTAFLILDDKVIGDYYSGSNIWYKIKYDNKELYVHSKLAAANRLVGEVTGNNVNVRASNNANSHAYGKVNKGDLVTILESGSDWHKISYKTWRNATSADVKYYLNPNNFINDEKQKFQFLDLSKPSGATVSQLNNFLKGKGVLNNMGQAFIDAAELNNINDLYLVSHAILETGHGRNATFVYNGVTVYNVFGIGAVDSNAYEGAAKTAYERGWTTPYKAIVGGASFIGRNYINTGQNTLYKMRWNPDAMHSLGYASHQYATDIGWAYKQINNIYNLYKEVGVNTVILEIPVYK